MGEVEELLTKKVADRYLKREVLGESPYSVVFKAIDTKTGQTVAIKKIRTGKQKERVNFTALWEFKLLKELKDPNIIELIDAFPHKDNPHLVFEFMETDLETVIRDRNIVLSPADIKSFLQMTLKGLAFCHKKWVLHRDMKPNNLLIGPTGQLKLADFGLACISQSPDRRFTDQVFARWYRAPELLFGAKQYGPGVDVWAAACIFAELLLRRPFLQGNSDIDQLRKIFAAFGTPKPTQWPDMIYLPDYVEYQYVPGQPLRTLFPMASDDTLDLLSKMFMYDPKSRISAQDALEHRYFTSGPLPTEPISLPRPAPKKESKSSDFNLQDGCTVLSPPRKFRRVMPNRDGPEGSANHVHKIDDHGNERLGGGEKSEHAPMSLDFSVFGMKPPVRPTINSSMDKGLSSQGDDVFAFFENLPEELVIVIFTRLSNSDASFDTLQDLKSLCQCSAVCKKFYSLFSLVETLNIKHPSCKSLYKYCPGILKNFKHIRSLQVKHWSYAEIIMNRVHKNLPSVFFDAAYTPQSYSLAVVAYKKFTYYNDLEVRDSLMLLDASIGFEDQCLYGRTRRHAFDLMRLHHMLVSSIKDHNDLQMVVVSDFANHGTFTLEKEMLVELRNCSSIKLEQLEGLVRSGHFWNLDFPFPNNWSGIVLNNACFSIIELSEKSADDPVHKADADGGIPTGLPFKGSVGVLLKNYLGILLKNPDDVVVHNNTDLSLYIQELEWDGNLLYA